MKALSIYQFKITIKMIEMRAIIYIIHEKIGIFLEIEENKQNMVTSDDILENLL